MRRLIPSLISGLIPGRKPAPKAKRGPRGSTGRKSAARKGPARPRRFKLTAKAMLFGALALVFLGSAGTGVWAVQSGWLDRQVVRTVQAFHDISARWGLAVGDVFVIGRERTSREDLLAALTVEIGTPVFTFDPWAARERIEALPWVRRAEVERRLSGTILLRIYERSPLAVWQLHGRLTVIDRTGEVISAAAPTDFSELPLVVGEDAPQHTAGLLSILSSEPELERRVTAAVRVSGRRWNVRLDDGIDVQLPESAPEEAWSELAAIERQHGVLRRDVMTIDLRLPDRLIIRTHNIPNPANSPEADGKET